jgi:hypothetical protein
MAQWAGASESVRFGLQTSRKNWQFALLYVSVNAFGTILTRLYPKSLGALLISFLLSLIFLVAFYRYSLKVADGKLVSIKDAFASSAVNYFRILGAGFLVLGLCLVSGIGLFIPLIWILPWTAFMSFAILDQNIGVFRSFGSSRLLALHHKAQFWSIVGRTFIYLLPFIVLGFLPYYGLVSDFFDVWIGLAFNIALARLYLYLKSNAVNDTAVALKST